MKHLPLAAVSVISALAFSISGAIAQDTAQPAPDTESQSQSTLGDTASAGESLESWDEARLQELGGETLMSDQGESLGEIQEFVRSSDDNEIYAVVSSEDALEIDDMTTVAVSDLSWQNDEVVYTGDAQELERMFSEQPYEEARYQPLDESQDQQAGIQESESDDIASSSQDPV